MYRITLLLALVCTAVPITARTHVDFDRAADFSRFHTYAWRPPDTNTMSQLMQQRVTAFVEEALAARRLKQVKTGGDLLVTYRVDVQAQEQFTTFTNATGFGPGWGWGGWGWGGWGWGSAISTTIPYTTYQRTLTVDIIDARTNRLVFEGVSTARIRSRPEKNTKEFAADVNEIFGKSPLR